MVIDFNRLNMKYRVIISFILLVLLISGCMVAKQEMSGVKYRPSRKVLQPDAFCDPYGSCEKSVGLTYELNALIVNYF